MISKRRYLIWDDPNQRSLSAILASYPGCENGLREAFLNQLTHAVFQRVLKFDLLRNRRERLKDEAGRGPETGMYMEIHEDFGVAKRSNWVAQQVTQEVYITTSLMIRSDSESNP